MNDGNAMLPVKSPGPSVVPPLEDINLFSSDAALQEAITREGAGPAAKRLSSFGMIYGSAEAFELGAQANRAGPRLMTHDRNGLRCDRLEYHPAYHDLLDMGVAEGMHMSAWSGLLAPQQPASPPRHGLYVERAGCLYMAVQIDCGHLRALSMTHSAVPALIQEAQTGSDWLPKIASRNYERLVPGATDRSQALVAFAIEEHSVSDAAALTTTAKPIGKPGPGALYRLHGHKCDVVAPTSDGFIVLAQATGGLACFFAPLERADGCNNAIQIEYLKNTVGLRSCATASLRFEGTEAWLIGEEGRGTAVLSDTGLHARLDAVTLTAGLMRQCLSQVVHAAAFMRSGSSALIAEPLMQQTLADLALDAEAASALGFRLARAFDRATDARAAAWRRLMTPVSMYWVSRRALALAAEAIDCLGSDGLSEDWPLARLYRDCPMVAMAGGTANAMALEVLRILQREPDVAETVMEELGQAAGDDPHLKAAHARVEAILHDPRHLDVRGRLLVDGLAVLAAGTILRAHVPAFVADAFIMTRMGNQPRQNYGQGLEWASTHDIVQRASSNEG